MKVTNLERAILALLAATVVSWFRWGPVLKTVDAYFGFNPGAELEWNLSIWKDATSAGNVWPDTNMLPFYLFWNLLGALGLTVGEAELVVLFLLFLGSMMSMHLLMTHHLRESNFQSSLARMLASVFYAANTFTMSLTWWRPLLVQFSWSLLPLLGYSLARVLSESSDRYPKYVVLGLFLAVALAPGMTGVAMVSILLFLVFTATFELSKKDSQLSTRKKTLRLLSALVVWGLGLAFFALPFLAAKETFLAGTSFASNPLTEARYFLEDASRYSTVTNVLSLMGLHSLYYRFYSDPLYNWSDAYIGFWPLRLLTYVPPLLAFSAALLNRKACNGFVQKLTLFVLLSIFLSKGLAPPFGQLNGGLLNLPGGLLFRHPYTVFAPLIVLGYSILIGYSVAYAPWEKLSRQIPGLKWVFAQLREGYDKIGAPKILRLRKRMVATLLVGTFLVAYAYPIWTGEVIYKGGSDMAAGAADIPPYLKDLPLLISNSSFSKVLAVPISLSGQTAYVWGRYTIQPNQDPILQYYLRDKSVLMTPTGDALADRVLRGMEEVFAEGQNISAIAKLAASWNIGYMVIHGDWHPSYTTGDVLDPLWYRSVVNPYPIVQGEAYSPSESSTFALLRHPWAAGSSVKSLSLSVTIRPNAIPGGSGVIFQNAELSVQWLKGASGGFFSVYIAGPERIWLYSRTVPVGTWYDLRFYADDEGASFAVNGQLVGSTTRSLVSDLFWLDNVSYLGGRPDYAVTFNYDLQRAELDADTGLARQAFVLAPGESTNVTFDEGALRLRNISGPNLSEYPTNLGKSGPLEVYEFDRVNPLLFASGSPVFIPEAYSTSAYVRIVSQYPLGDRVVFTTIETNADTLTMLTEIQNSGLVAPEIRFHRRGPANYGIQVTGARGPWILVFLEGFSPTWRLSTTDSVTIGGVHHFVANGFANGWIVNQSGDFSLVLENTMQEIYALGAGITVTSSAITVVWVISRKRIKIRRPWKWT